MEKKKYGVNALREMFLSYFEDKGHLRLPSFSLIPQNDASLLLINSGMAPMKPYFKGDVTPPRSRVCTCQKCVRTGDIDNIGHTERHGTYFEMLGNFSFGDYFKREAIAWCWDFLVNVCNLEESRLYPSVYENDDEAFAIWNTEMGIAKERIFRFGKADNFWEHGSGPCGPCSEVYYDRGEKYGCGKPDCTVGCDCDRYMEVWNNVFSQFDNDGHGNYTDLAQKNIDTGMGLERLAVAVQDVGSLFEVDTVMNITNKVTEITGASYGKSREMDVSLRVITDHIRASVFMIADGVQPRNEGRGYVLRRLLRRAARHGKFFGINRPFLCDVVETVVRENEGHYAYLRQQAAHITRVIRVEEENFAKTIDGGMRIFEEMLAAHKARGAAVFSGADAFKLYDTYGFPVDLTREMASEAGLGTDLETFQTLMQEQKLRAKEARKALGDLAWAGIDFGLDNTPTEFCGYETLSCTGSVLAVCVGDELSDAIASGEKGILVLDRTSLYAEMGGQVADHGEITCGEAVFAVEDVQKDKSGKYLHYGQMRSGAISVGDSVSAAVDADRRHAICRAHTATHLLQSALERELGEHCHQAGSLVEPDHLRFDFTHFSALSAQELADVVENVAEMILRGEQVETLVLPLEEAKKLGATALFGEKYGDTVRVVKMGDTSMEFCGGTHLDNTAKVGPVRVSSEASVASGVRRIEMYTGKAVLRHMEQQRQVIADAAGELKTTPHELLQRVHAVMTEMKDLRQSLDNMKDKLFNADVERSLGAAKDVAGLKVLTMIRSDVDANDLRKMGDFLRDREESIVAVLASAQGEKITLLAVCGKQAIARGVKAGALVKQVSALCGGSGGGKPDSAMGGGKDVQKMGSALAAVDTFVAENATA
ncbi:MAG: alanine--tRNA ligase [Oscillospiraceae bacterium]|nr:alanine--tRNA ligase [Oscillospiraceae bacterium]